MPTVDRIRFNGILFRRYPDSKQWAHRSYYVPGIADRDRGFGFLHQEIWKSTNGPIPAGHEIHHVDFDPLNNDPGNLACLTIAEHKEAHRARNRERGRSPEHLAQLAEASKLAPAWHRSDAGREWHRQHARSQGFGRVGPIAATCEHCGRDYEHKKPSGAARYCSNNCKSAARRASGVDNENRACVRCGATFVVNRYSPTRCCGRTCAQRLRAAA